MVVLPRSRIQNVKKLRSTYTYTYTHLPLNGCVFGSASDRKAFVFLVGWCSVRRSVRALSLVASSQNYCGSRRRDSVRSTLVSKFILSRRRRRCCPQQPKRKKEKKKQEKRKENENLS